MNEVHETPPLRFSESLDRLKVTIEAAPLKMSLRDVVLIFGPKGHVLLTLFFVLPFLQPIPIPGLSTALGFCIFMVGYFMFLDEPPWIPDRVAKISVEKKFLLRVTSALETLLRKIEHIVRPRGQAIFAKSHIRAFHGLLLAFHAFLLALPLPIPFSNFLPAIVLLLIALGCLEEDFAVASLGYLAALANAAFFIVLALSPFYLKNVLT